VTISVAPLRIRFVQPLSAVAKHWRHAADMRRFKAIVSLCLVTLALAGCGQKGPLYLPEEPAAANTQAQ